MPKLTKYSTIFLITELGSLEFFNNLGIYITVN